jgi:Domain of unknown function (DUF4126)
MGGCGVHVAMGMALAAAAGWNAFLPLVALAIAHRASHRIPIASPYTFLSSTLGLIVLLAALLPIELFIDKAPGLDARNDRVAILYRPLAGALIMLATTRDTALPGIAAAIIGAALALGMHVLKVRYRRPLASLMSGLITPVASAMEDGTVLLITLAGLLLPILGIILAALSALGIWLIGRVVRRRAASVATESLPVTATAPTTLT